MARAKGSQKKVMKNVKQTKKFQRFSSAERALAWQWKKAGKGDPEIAELLERDVSTVHRQLKKPQNYKPKLGRKRIMTKPMFKKLEGALHQLQKARKGLRETTLPMAIKRAGIQASQQVCREALQAHGIYFYKLREKPILTKEDIPKRRGFANEHEDLTPEDWNDDVHGHMDNKHYTMYLNHTARAHNARRGIRGAYRTADRCVDPYFVKQKNTIKFPAPSLCVTAVVIKGKIRVWHYTDGRWNSGAACAMFKKALAPALRKAFPDHGPRKKFQVLHDNDPVGYKTKSAEVVKKELRIDSLCLPPRSPDLNVLDYSLWHEINVRMRLQESTFPMSFKESKQAFKKRLRRTALLLPASVVRRAVGDMTRRCRLIKAAKGGLIVE